MQAFTREIEADAGLVAMNIDMNLDIGLFFCHHRPAAAEIAQAVDNRILGLERDIVRMIEFRARKRRRHGNTVARLEMLFPFDLVDGVVQPGLVVDRGAG